MRKNTILFNKIIILSIAGFIFSACEGAKTERNTLHMEPGSDNYTAVAPSPQSKVGLQSPELPISEAHGDGYPQKDLSTELDVNSKDARSENFQLTAPSTDTSSSDTATMRIDPNVIREVSPGVGKTLKSGLNLKKDLLNPYTQLFIVIADNWTSNKAYLKIFIRDQKGKWIPTEKSFPVVLGKNGLGWGIGLHEIPSQVDDSNIKQEGDGKAPAGIFNISTKFIRDTYLQEFPDCNVLGTLEAADKKNIIEITRCIKAIDDNKSKYYNQIVDENQVEKDWNSEEDMYAPNLKEVYNIGAVIDHNFSGRDKKAGSCIFLHVWRSSTSSTAGCTAMSRENMEEIFTSLNDNNKTALVQLPRDVYEGVKKMCDLP